MKPFSLEEYLANPTKRLITRDGCDARMQKRMRVLWQKVLRREGGIVMSSNYNEDYLNGLIAKAKKSWEGVDVESFMSELRDIEKEQKVLENLKKAIEE